MGVINVLNAEKFKDKIMYSCDGEFGFTDGIVKCTYDKCDNCIFSNRNNQDKHESYCIVENATKIYIEQMRLEKEKLQQEYDEFYDRYEKLYEAHERLSYNSEELKKENKELHSDYDDLRKNYNELVIKFDNLYSELYEEGYIEDD